MKLKPEEICQKYQETKQDVYIFVMFSKVFDSIYSISGKYRTVDTTDIVSNALTCLADVMTKFDCTQKVKFDTWFSRCFERVMYAVFKPQLCKKRIPEGTCISMDDSKNTLMNYEASISRTGGSPDAVVADYLCDEKASDSFINVDLVHMLQHLTPKKHVNDIFVMLYEGYNVKQINAKMPNYSESTIRNIIYNYKHEVRKCIEACR
jgi:DNA-directed RNA polymerase specialized sigma24 family protein